MLIRFGDTSSRLKGSTPEYDPRGCGLADLKGDRLAIGAFDSDCRKFFAATEPGTPVYQRLVYRLLPELPTRVINLSVLHSFAS